MKRFFPWLKSFILMGIPTIISAIGVAVSLISFSSRHKVMLVIFNIFLLVIYMFAVVIYSRNEVNLNSLKTDLEASNEIIIVYKRLFEHWAKKIYDFAEAVKDNSVTNLSWDKLGYYDMICFECCEMIKRFCSTQEDNISVNFIEYKVDKNGEEFIEMIIDTNQSSTKPRSFEIKEKLSESKYHYAELIRKKFKGIEVATNNEDIRRIFKKINPDADMSKYTQYIAIPIYCKKNKLLGIFEIITEYDCIIESEKKKLLKFAKEKITPYTNSILLVDKIHKGLYATPEDV